MNSNYLKIEKGSISWPGRIFVLYLILRGGVTLIVLIHFYCAFFNYAGWSNVVRTPEIELVYPKVVQWINEYTFEGIQGFLVAGAVILFFLASGYTTFCSVEKRGIIQFWKRKLRRLVPFYGVILCINMLIALLASYIYKTGFTHEWQDILLQMLLGLQFFIPHAVVLDLVIWFLAVDLVFWMFASVLLRPKLGRYRFFIFDIVIVTLIILVNYLAKNGLQPFTAENYFFMIKSLSLSLLIVTGTMFANKKTNGGSYLAITGQFVFFLIIYRLYIDEIGYVLINEYIPWFSCYFLLFWLLFVLEDVLPDYRLLKYLSDISFSLYFCHGYMGYFITVTFISFGLSKGVSALLAVPVVLAEATLLHRYVEKI